MKIHTLKTDWPHYVDVISGRKKAEVRFHDRDYQVGDFLELHEFRMDAHTGRKATYEITHILKGGQFGIDENWCVLSLGELKGLR